jgi:integrase/recombinase XerD
MGSPRFWEVGWFGVAATACLASGFQSPCPDSAFHNVATLQGTLRKVSLWLDHAQMQTTEIYLRMDPTEKIDAIEKVTPPSLKRGRFTVPDKLIVELQGTTRR